MTDIYTLEQAEEDIAELRGLVDRMTEVMGLPAGILQVQGTLAATDPVNLGAETWHAIPLVNSWANVGGNQPAQYKLLADSNKVHLRGAISGGTSVTISSALPAAYQPAVQQQAACGATTITGVAAGSAVGLFLQITTGGIISLGGLPAGAAVGSVVFNGEYALA